MTTRRAGAWSTAATLLTAAVAVASMSATEAIKQRQLEMEGVRNGMAALGAIAKKEQPFTAEAVGTAAGKIADHLAAAAELFPEGSDAGDVQTWAKPEIWTDRAAFDELLESTRQAAVGLQGVTEPEAFGPALGKLGAGCKSCHDLYRLPKQ
ncbi:MAG: cytochrome c [Thermoanaerobaculales bacterium]|jgi:cytochrome c556|nr:cytochrome c [Thermoanaerobaculales bacterium]